jgi:hypothetical protein
MDSLTCLSAALLAWLLAAAIVLAIEMAVSVAETGRLVRAAIVSSSPAVWMVPAALLLRPETAPVAVAAGLLLTANTAHALFRRVSPRKVRRKRIEVPAAPPIFGSAVTLDAPRQGLSSMPGVAGAFALQAGGWALVCSQRVAAAVLVAAGVAVWTRFFVRRGAWEPNRNYGFVRVLRNVIPATLLALLLSTLSPQPQATEEAGQAVGPTGTPAGAGKRSAAKLVAPPREQTAPPGGIPGLVLRPRVKARSRAPLIAARKTVLSSFALSLAQPLTIEFTGEYRIYRLSSGAVPPQSQVEAGSPLEGFYGTTNGSVMVTEAWQPLRPALDLAKCGKVRLSVASREEHPTVTTLQLITAAGMRDLGRDVFGRAGVKQETMEFVLPKQPGRLVATAIRIQFSTFPEESYRSAKVAVERLTFVPRGL